MAAHPSANIIKNRGIQAAFRSLFPVLFSGLYLHIKRPYFVESYPTPPPPPYSCNRAALTLTTFLAFTVDAYPIQVIVSRVEGEGEEDTELFRSDQRDLFRKYGSRRTVSIKKIKRAVQ